LPAHGSQAKKQITMNNDPTTSPLFDEDDRVDPLDWIEHYLIDENIGFERSTDGDLSFAIEGTWRRFDLWFSYRPEGDAIQLCCAIDLDPHTAAPKTQMISSESSVSSQECQDLLPSGQSDYDYDELSKLLVLINQHVWFGHYDLVQRKPLSDKLLRSAPKDLTHDLSDSEIVKQTEPAETPAESFEIVFRLTLPLGGMEPGSTQHFAFMVHAVTETVERFLPAFELWQFDGLKAADAFAACLFETQGEA